MTRRWFPHLCWAGEPMREGEFREPYPMAEELYPCGHPRTPENTKRTGNHPSGRPKLKCRICRREIERRAKVKAGILASPPLPR